MVFALAAATGRYIILIIIFKPPAARYAGGRHLGRPRRAAARKRPDDLGRAADPEYLAVLGEQYRVTRGLAELNDFLQRKRSGCDRESGGRGGDGGRIMEAGTP